MKIALPCPLTLKGLRLQVHEFLNCGGYLLTSYHKGLWFRFLLHTLPHSFPASSHQLQRKSAHCLGCRCQHTSVLFVDKLRMLFGFYFSFLTFVFSLRLTISFFCSKIGLFRLVFFFFLNLWLNNQNTSQYGKTYGPPLATAGICLDALSFCSDGNRLGLFSIPGTEIIWGPLSVVPLGLADPSLSCPLPLLFPVPFPLSCFSSLALHFLPRGSSVV